MTHSTAIRCISGNAVADLWDAAEDVLTWEALAESLQSIWFTGEYNIPAVAHSLKTATENSLPDEVVIDGLKIYAPTDAVIDWDAVRSAIAEIDTQEILERHRTAPTAIYHVLVAEPVDFEPDDVDRVVLIRDHEAMGTAAHTPCEVVARGGIDLDMGGPAEFHNLTLSYVTEFVATALVIDPARVYPYPTGYTDGDITHPNLGVASSEWLIWIDAPHGHNGW